MLKRVHLEFYYTPGHWKWSIERYTTFITVYVLLYVNAYISYIYISEIPMQGPSTLKLKGVGNWLRQSQEHFGCNPLIIDHFLGETRI